jgi:serine/threonine protein kinase
MSEKPTGDSKKRKLSDNRPAKKPNSCPNLNDHKIEVPLRASLTEKDHGINYLPVKYSDVESCMNNWEKKSQLGKGCFGSVFEACKDKTCGYIMKISNIADQYRFDTFQREQYFLNKLNSSEISPKIYDSWICNENGYIVLEKWDGDLENLNLFYVKDGKLCVYKWVWDQMITCILEMSKRKIIHGDIKPSNFLAIKKDRRVCISDFGTSIDYKTEVLDDPKAIKLGWHYSRFACRAQKDFAEMYNLWNLEIYIRASLHFKKMDYLYIIDDKGEETPFLYFENITDQQRTSLDATCVIKPPKSKQ